MMFKRYAVMLALLAGTQFVLFSQTLSPLERGDKVPDFPIDQVTNYRSDVLRLSDFRGQWILIDFWGAGCIGCVGSFPMLDSMQRKYAGKLQVLLVSKNSGDQLDKFVNALRKKVTLPNVPRVVSDTVLGQFFPYVAVPYHVWVDPDGRFYAGTSSSNFTPDNIDRLLNGERPYFKPSVYVRYADYTKASIVEVATGMKPAVKTEYSYFTGYIPKGSTLGYEASRVDSVSQTMRVSYSNMNLVSLAIKTVDRNNGYPFRNRIYYDLQDINRVIEPEDDALIDTWKENNVYSYEVQTSLKNAADLTQRVRKDILGYLKSSAGITVYEDKRKIRVVKAILRDGGASLKADSSRLEYRLFPNLQKTGFDFYFWRPISAHYARQNIFFEQDFERIDFPVDISVGMHWQNLDSLKATLAPQGIDLVEEEVEDMVLVISDRSHLQPQIGPIATGQRVPDDFWDQEHMIYRNGDTATTDFSAYKDKFLVLDFWNKGCATCIHSFPAMKELQAKFGDKLNIIAVNDRDALEDVKTMYHERLKEKRIDDMPTIVEDTYLANLFHKAGYPHYVWITPGGNVIMQTFSIHFMTDEAIAHIMQVDGFFPKQKPVSP